MQYAIVFITAPTKKEANKIGKVLLDKRIIACANIIKDVDSYFWWQGKKERATEFLMICKTTKALLKKLIKEVRAIHSYDVPEVIAIPIIAGYRPYLDWIKEVV
ncbi:divalent-cation tolerance protein CutA [Candidatus Omnitrophota bacterium]